MTRHHPGRLGSLLAAGLLLAAPLGTARAATPASLPTASLTPAEAQAQPLLAAPLAPTGGGSFSTPVISGLPWRSGASFDVDCIAQIRGRPLDVVLSFLGHKSFPALVGYAAGARGAARADCGSVRGRVAGEAEPAPRVPGGDRGQRRAEGGLQGLLRAGADRPQPGLEFGPGRFDRVQTLWGGRRG